MPQDERRALTKGEIALELLDAVRAEGNLPGQIVVADCGYGVSGALRAGLAARGWHYLLGVTEEMMVLSRSHAGWSRGRAGMAGPAGVPAAARCSPTTLPSP